MNEQNSAGTPQQGPGEGEAEELKGCPFCGGAAKLCDHAIIMCSKCGAVSSGLASTLQVAVAYWNRRAPVAASKALDVAAISERHRLANQVFASKTSLEYDDLRTILASWFDLKDVLEAVASGAPVAAVSGEDREWLEKIQREFDRDHAETNRIPEAAFVAITCKYYNLFPDLLRIALPASVPVVGQVGAVSGLSPERIQDIRNNRVLLEATFETVCIANPHLRSQLNLLERFLTLDVQDLHNEISGLRKRAQNYSINVPGEN